MISIQTTTKPQWILLLNMLNEKNNIDNIKRLINFIFIILYNLYTMFSSISSESTGMNHTRPQSRSENAQKVTYRMTNS